MRKVILLALAMVVCLICYTKVTTETDIEVQEIKVSSAKPVKVPYLNITMEDVRKEQSYDANRNGRNEEVDAITRQDGETESVVGENSDGIGEADESDSIDTSDSGDVGEAASVWNSESVPELVVSGECNDSGEAGTEEYSTGDSRDDDDISPISGSGLIYLGDWTITAYCPCEVCCGQWATGYTASGNPAISGHTIACNSLPFYSKVMIDGIEYTVEDTGSTEYGDAWIDIFFDTHEEALAYGVQTREVYLVE